MNALIFGNSGSGKTVNSTLVKGKNLLINTDNSSIVLQNFDRPNLDIISVDNVSDFLTSYKEGYKSKKYDNIILDNISDFFDMYILELDATGKGGPLDFSTLHADRIRLRWVIQETGVEASVINRMTTTLSTPVSVRFYNLQGIQLNQQPTHGFYIEHRIAADGRRDVRKSYR